jgi:hypothetical protein
MDFNEIDFFSHSMLVEESTLKNHFTIHPKIEHVWAMFKVKNKK